jgi:hypothetical protein
MLRRVALVRTDVSGELSVSVIRVTRISELGINKGTNPSQNTAFFGSICDESYVHFIKHSVYRALTSGLARQSTREIAHPDDVSHKQRFHVNV